MSTPDLDWIGQAPAAEDSVADMRQRYFDLLMAKAEHDPVVPAILDRIERLIQSATEPGCRSDAAAADRIRDLAERTHAEFERIDPADAPLGTADHGRRVASSRSPLEHPVR